MEKEMLIANKIINDLKPTIETIENELFNYVIYYYSRENGLIKFEYKHFEFLNKVKKILKEKI